MKSRYLLNTFLLVNDKWLPPKFLYTFTKQCVEYNGVMPPDFTTTPNQTLQCDWNSVWCNRYAVCDVEDEIFGVPDLEHSRSQRSCHVKCPWHRKSQCVQVIGLMTMGGQVKAWPNVSDCTSQGGVRACAVCWYLDVLGLESLFQRMFLHRLLLKYVFIFLLAHVLERSDNHFQPCSLSETALDHMGLVEIWICGVCWNYL